METEIKITEEERDFLILYLKGRRDARLDWINGNPNARYLPKNPTNEDRERWAKEVELCGGILKKLGYSPTKKIAFELTVPEDTNAFEVSKMIVSIAEASHGTVKRIFDYILPVFPTGGEE